MTAPQLKRMKFYIVKPYGGYNYLKNPTFAEPVGITYWSFSNATAAVTSQEQRRGAYSMKVTPVSGKSSYATYAGLAVTPGFAYTFSCDVKGVAGQAMRIYIGTYTAKTFTATGYWQRVQITSVIPAGVTTSYVVVQRDAVASSTPFYVDGVQFEQAMAMSTFIEGNQEGCGWVGLPYHSTSWRDPLSTAGGELLCINDYAKIISVHGFGMGNWNQIMTKMTTGGDMYQTHIRTSRNISMVLAYNGKDQGELQANRKVILDALRPDLAEGQQRIIRYQGVDENGNEATEPIDIICVFQPSHADTPDTPVFQKDILNFTVPSGLFQGAYNEGAELDWNAEFPAEFIVKRDKNGNWCKWNGTAYESLITGLNNWIYRLIEGPDGKIYAAGTFTNSDGTEGDRIARWNSTSKTWENVISGILSTVYTMEFDANGDLYIGGAFAGITGATNCAYIAKITGLSPGGTPKANALGTGLNGLCRTLVIDADGNVFAGGDFTLAGGIANTAYIAKWNGTSWSALSTGLNARTMALAVAPNNDLFIGGEFTNADGVNGDYLCEWIAQSNTFKRIGTVELNNHVFALAVDFQGTLLVGGAFTDAGGIDNANYIAKWTGSKWEALGSGVNNNVWHILIGDDNTVYAAGQFTSAGDLLFTDRIAIYKNGAWQPMDIDLPGTSAIYAVLVASDGSLYIGGAFSTAGSSGVNAKCGIVSDRVFTLGVTSASANTYPVVSVTGPGTLKSITNYRTGKSVMFDGLTLQAGEWISLNFDPLNLSFRSGWAGRGNLMRYIIPGSDYGDFYVSPGANYISLFMDNTTSATKASIVWTPNFWGLDGALL